MARHDPCPKTHPKAKGGVVLLALEAAESFPPSESGTGQTNILAWPYFLPLWAAGKNPTQSNCQSTVRFAPNAKGG